MTTMYQTLYVSGTGNDRNDGQTADAPLKTLEAAQRVLSDNCELLLEGGYRYTGHLELNGLRHVRVGRYGFSTPILETGEATGIRVYRCQDIVLAGLKLIGRGWDCCNQTSGVHLGLSERVTVKNMEITGYHVVGIGIHSGRDTTITGCFIHDNGSTGIHTGRDTDGEPCSNTRIAFCKVYDNAGDYGNRYNHSGSGIIIAGADKTIVEFCEAAANGWAQRQYNVNGPVGIWCCCDCTNAVFRYNIARYNRTQPGAVDGDGMDVDGESNNCLLEYNYTYGNEGSGYLFCEFYGDCTDTLWFNNAMRHCVSFDDDQRVGNYGALAISSPEDIPFHDMQIHRNLFVGREGKKTIYNRQIPACAKDLYITENVLITDGCAAISDTDHPNMVIRDNAELADGTMQRVLTERAPRLSEPRDLLRQPVFAHLEQGNCAAVLREQGADALFSPTNKQIIAEGFRMMEVQLYGPDTEGSDKKGDVALHYDTLASSVVTRLRGAGAQVSVPLPWWTQDRHYIVRARVRLQSPDIQAYLFLNNIEKEEARVYLHGSAAEYVYTELPFVGNEKWFDPGKYIGVRVEGGSGCLYVHSLEFIELAEDSAYEPATEFGELYSYRSFGDCYRDGEALVMNDGAYMEKTLPVTGGAVSIRIRHAGETGGSAYLRDAEGITELSIPKGTGELTLTRKSAEAFVSFGVRQDCFAAGRLELRDVCLV